MKQENQMQIISQAERDNIARVLQEKNALQPCPRCGEKQFTLLDGYFNEPIQSKPNNLNIGGQCIPSVVVICNNCGYMSQHALGMLNIALNVIDK